VQLNKEGDGAGKGSTGIFAVVKNNFNQGERLHFYHSYNAVHIPAMCHTEKT
jgi:hypothetical protein